MFSDYIQIDEEILAKRSKVPIDTIFQYLNRLKASGVINYIPKRNNPVIVFTEERLDDKTLYLSPDNYNQRKDRFLKRIEAMLTYASSSNKCRSQILLSYFGDKDADRCGQCDVCSKRNELELSKYEFDMILEKIKEIVHEKQPNSDDLLNELEYSTDKSIKVLQWLLDNNKIIKQKDLTLIWCSD